MRGKILTWLVWGPKWETLKKMGQLCGWETKMAPGGRDRGVVYVTVFDWLS